jgi:hypothetical protein
MSRRENTLLRNVFGPWMVKHIDTWFAFARNLGLVHQMEEIILVTGCDLTRSWTNVAFLGGRADAQVSFGVEVRGPTSNPSINFQFSPGRVRGAVLRCGPEGTVCFTPFETITDFNLGTTLCSLEPARKSMCIYPRISCCPFHILLAKASQSGRWSLSRRRGIRL